MGKVDAVKTDKLMEKKSTIMEEGDKSPIERQIKRRYRE